MYATPASGVSTSAYPEIGEASTILILNVLVTVTSPQVIVATKALVKATSPAPTSGLVTTRTSPSTFK